MPNVIEGHKVIRHLHQPVSQDSLEITKKYEIDKGVNLVPTEVFVLKSIQTTARLCQSTFYRIKLLAQVYRN